MPVIKCKYCCNVITEADGVWYDSGMWLQKLCMLSNDHRHAPMTEENEAKIREQMFLTSNEYEDSKNAT